MTEEFYTICKWLEENYSQLNPSISTKDIRIWSSDGEYDYHTTICYDTDSSICVSTGLKIKRLMKYDLIRPGLKGHNGKAQICTTIDDPKCFDKLAIILDIIDDDRKQNHLLGLIHSYENSTMGYATLAGIIAIIMALFVYKNMPNTVGLTAIITWLLAMGILIIKRIKHLNNLKKLYTQDHQKASPEPPIDRHDNDKCKKNGCPCIVRYFPD